LILKLPRKGIREQGQNPMRGVVRFSLSQTLSSQLKELSQREGVTLFLALVTAFMALLSRYTSQADILLDTSVEGRNRAETDGLIGYFVNMLVLHVNASGQPTFRELLHRVRENALNA